MAVNWSGKFLRGEKLERWCKFTGTDGSCEFLMVYPKPAEWQAFFASRKDTPQDTPEADKAFRAFLASHVHDWRGLLIDGASMPFDRDNVVSAQANDNKFGKWLLDTLSDAGSFRSPAGDSAASPAGLATEDAASV